MHGKLFPFWGSHNTEMFMKLQTFLREEKQSRTAGCLISSLMVIINLVLLPKDFLKLKVSTLINYSLQLSTIRLRNCFLLLLHLRIQISKVLILKQPTYMVIWMRKSVRATGAQDSRRILRDQDEAPEGMLLQKVTYLFCDELDIVSKELRSRVRQATKDVVKSEV